jgi:hypothetical protein
MFTDTARNACEGVAKMNKKIFGVVLGLTALAASTAASAHVNVGVGIGIPVGVYAPAEPVYAPPPPVVYAPAPVAVAYGDYNGWRVLKWRPKAPDPQHPTLEYLRMKASSIRIALIATTLVFGAAGTANAAGCLKGAVVGGVAGHYAGHHAVVGAVGGCMVGRHLAKQRAQEQAAQQQAAHRQVAQAQ